MIKHTLGPWKVVYCSSTDCGWPQIESEHEEEIVVSHRLMSLRMSEANARLIAAAPELLEACQQAEKALTSGGDITKQKARNMIEQAIAKAEAK